MKKLLGILISLTLILSASFGVMASVKNTESDLYYSDDFCNEEEVFNAWQDDPKIQELKQDNK